jgi:cytochrome c oxidase subunit 2
MNLLLASSDIQSALAPAGRQAAQISHLWWVYFWVLTSVFVLVAIALFIAISRGRPGPAPLPRQEPIVVPTETSERRISNAVIGCVIATVLILFGLLFWDFIAGRTMYALSSDKEFLRIKVTGHQWWWEVQYQDPLPSNVMTTANEIHVPVGKTVRLELQSNDVIHSFWVPNMHGKKDLIPGHPTVHYLKADREGTFRGQCAEFCGHQHAHMRLEFVAQSPQDFDAWYASSLQNGQSPTTDSERRGQQVFLANQCIMCHTIEGTNARATVGPDLTHIASRKLLAAGAVPNTRGYLAGWIANPQNIKPGVRMPPNPLSPDDLNALVDYLESLK